MRSDPSVSLHFLHFHRGRQSVVLDRDTPEGYDAFERLVASADVLVEDESSASLDHEALRALNPGLIHARISGFGASGPRAGWKSSDLVAQAAGSLMYRMGFPEDPPNSMGEGFAHHQTSAHAAAGILLALARRDATGAGGFVDASLQEGIALMQYDVMPMYVTHKTLIKRAGHGQGSSGKRYRRIWECNHGLVRFQLLSQSSDREWPLLLDWPRVPRPRRGAAGRTLARPGGAHGWTRRVGAGLRPLLPHDGRTHAHARGAGPRHHAHGVQQRPRAHHRPAARARRLLPHDRSRSHDAHRCRPALPLRWRPPRGRIRPCPRCGVRPPLPTRGEGWGEGTRRGDGRSGPLFLEGRGRACQCTRG